MRASADVARAGKNALICGFYRKIGTQNEPFAQVRAAPRRWPAARSRLVVDYVETASI